MISTTVVTEREAVAKQTVAPVSAPASASAPIRVIGPWRSSVRARLYDLWWHKRMVPYYGRSYIRRRYRNTWLGWIWLPLRPTLDTLGKVFIFGGMLNVSGGDRPYIIFFTFGNAGWILFQRTTYWATRSMRVSRSFVRNAHPAWLPKVFAVIFAGAMDFFLYVAIALIAVVYYWVVRGHLYLAPSKETLSGFAGIILLGIWGLALGLWLAPFSVYSRDVRFLFGYVMGFWYFVTPIVYDISKIPATYRPIAKYNPLTGPVELVKYGFLSTGPPAKTSMLISLIVLAVALVGGLRMFNNFEKAAVERI